MKESLKLFTTALVQVLFVSANMIFIAHNKILELTITGFLISIIWSYNIKRVAFGTFLDRIIYATGACIGTLLGYLLANYLVKII